HRQSAVPVGTRWARAVDGQTDRRREPPRALRLLSARGVRARRLPPRTRRVLEPRLPLPPRSPGAGAGDLGLPRCDLRVRGRRRELSGGAYLLEHNTAWAVVARKLCLRMIHRAPDAGNPDSAAVRLVFADRKLTPAQLEATLSCSRGGPELKLCQAVSPHCLLRVDPLRLAAENRDGSTRRNHPCAQIG